MSEFRKITDGEFFIIDSNNLESVNTKLYGYIIEDGQILMDSDFTYDGDMSPIGTYVYVKKTDREISIYQDFDGCYGIYIFEDGKGNFCFSNSFLYLIDYVKYKYELSFNEDYAKSYLTSTLCSFAYRQTLVNEIETLPRNYVAHINLKTKEIEYEIIDYEENTVPLNSKEGIEILDDWFYRWTSLFHNIKQQNNNVHVDLSGGFDTRTVLSLLLSSDIDLNEITVNSLNDGKHVHDEDFRIASQIANEFNFKLNNRSNLNLTRYNFKDIETAINISFYTKLGFHNQMYFRPYKNITPFYSIGGTGGEIIRGYEHDSIDSFLNRARNISPDFVEPTKRVLEYNMENIKNDFNYSDMDKNFDAIQYKEIRRRYHYSRGNMEMYLYNVINLTPLTDVYLSKLMTSDENCEDSKLLISLIYLRYCPKLLDFEFEGGRTIDERTIEYAKQINAKYPFTKQEFKTKEVNKYCFNDLPETKLEYNLGDINDFLKKIFLSNAFKKSFEIYFSSEIYEDIKSKVERMDYFQLQHTYPAFAILKIINDIKISKNENDLPMFEWLNHFINLPSIETEPDYQTLNLLLNYLTARIDVINFGGDINDVELINISDPKALIISPKWLESSDGYGNVIQSHKGSLDLLVKCVGEGRLRISLRGRDIYDRNGKRFPMYIDFTKFTVNEEDILKEPKLVWHDTPYVHFTNVFDGELISIHLEWKPFDRTSSWD